MGGLPHPHFGRPIGQDIRLLFTCSALLFHRSIYFGSSPAPLGVYTGIFARPPALSSRQAGLSGIAGTHARWRGVRGHFCPSFGHLGMQ